MEYIKRTPKQKGKGKGKKKKKKKKKEKRPSKTRRQNNPQKPHYRNPTPTKRPRLH
jgi:hypothetical protein